MKKKNNTYDFYGLSCSFALYFDLYKVYKMSLFCVTVHFITVWGKGSSDILWALAHGKSYVSLVEG